VQGGLFVQSPKGERVEKGWRGEAEPYAELGQGGATRSETALENGTLRANVPAE
jgi:hypothetical protein